MTGITASSDQAACQIPDPREFSSVEEGSLVANSDISSLYPNRDKGQRHWDECCDQQEMVLTEQRSPCTALKD